MTFIHKKERIKNVKEIDKMKAKLAKIVAVIGLIISICLLAVNTLIEYGFIDYDISGSRTELTDTLEVHYIDIGQGDCTLIKCGDKAMLIDAGENDKGTQVQAYLESQNVTTLDYVIGTHPDSDHIGGLDVIIYKFDCKTILMPDKTKTTKTYRDVVSAMKAKNYTNTLPEVGKEYSLGDATFTIIAPNGEYESANDSSIGLLLKYGEKTFLFTGDAEEEAEADIVENGIDIECDVYHAGHHGSRTSSSEVLLDAAKPAYVVISCGEDNSYGHPHAQALNSFRYRGMNVFRTDEQGTIVAKTDGVTITWNCSPSDTWKAGEPKGK